MLIETLVLGRDQRVDHLRRDFLKLDPLAIRLFELGQQLAVGIQDPRRPLQCCLADVADARRERDQDQYIQQQHAGNSRQQAKHIAAARMAQTHPDFGKHRGKPEANPGRHLFDKRKQRIDGIHGQLGPRRYSSKMAAAPARSLRTGSPRLNM